MVETPIDDSDPISRFLRNVTSYRIEREDQRRAMARIEAPDFNLFDFLKADETGLSAVLRWLLDPCASHGQDDAFLRLFLQHFVISDEMPTAHAVATVEVSTSHIANTRRRIDVQVRCGDKVVAIENKPWAAWQPNQVPDYLRELRKAAPGGFWMILLQGRSRTLPQLQRAAIKRMGLAGRVLEANYDALADWLRQCAELCAAPRVSLMLSDLERFVEREFREGLTRMQSNELLAVALATEDNLISALRIVQAGDRISCAIFERLAAEIGRQASERSWAATTDLPAKSTIQRIAKAVFVDIDRRSPVLVGFGATRGQYPWMGICWRGKRSARLERDAQSALKGMRADWTFDDLWPWYFHLDDADFSRPGLDLNDPVAVQAVLFDSETMAGRIIGWASAIHERLPW